MAFVAKKHYNRFTKEHIDIFVKNTAIFI